MDLSTQLAMIIGPLYLTIAAGLLINRSAYRQIATGFLDNPALLYLSGMIAFVLGATLILIHNLWVSDWRIIITLIGWVALIKGVVLLIFPGAMRRLSAAISASRPMIIANLLIAFALGGILTLMGHAPWLLTGGGL